MADYGCGVCPQGAGLTKPKPFAPSNLLAFALCHGYSSRWKDAPGPVLAQVAGAVRLRRGRPLRRPLSFRFRSGGLLELTRVMPLDASLLVRCILEQRILVKPSSITGHEVVGTVWPKIQVIRLPTAREALATESLRPPRMLRDANHWRAVSRIPRLRAHDRRGSVGIHVLH